MSNRVLYLEDIIAINTGYLSCFNTSPLKYVPNAYGPSLYILSISTIKY